METILNRVADYGAMAAVLAFMLWVGYTKILPLWKDTITLTDKAIQALSEHLEWIREKNGKKDK